MLVTPNLANLTPSGLNIAILPPGTDIRERMPQRPRFYDGVNRPTTIKMVLRRMRIIVHWCWGQHEKLLRSICAVKIILYTLSFNFYWIFQNTFKKRYLPEVMAFIRGEFSENPNFFGVYSPTSNVLLHF